MRQKLLCCAVAFVVACAVPARGQSNQFELSLLVAPGGSYSDYNGYDFSAGLGASVGWRFGHNWAVQGRFLQGDADSADTESFQLGLRYAFLDDGVRWRPFVIGGLHHAETELRREVVCVSAPCPDLEQSFDDNGIFAGGGVDWQLNNWFALRLEAQLLVYDSELYDDTEIDVDGTVGAVFRF
jgi:hypothetical protein